VVRNSIRTKTIIGVALIEAVLLISLVILMLGYIKESNYEALEVRAQTTSRLFAATAKDAVLSFDLATLNSFVNEVMTNPGLEYARVINAQGQLMAASEGADTLSRTTDLSLDDVNDGIFDTRSVIREGGEIFGWVEVGFNTDPVRLVIENAKRWSYSIVALEMILVAVFSFVLGRFLTNKLSALRDAAMSIGRGDLSTRITVKGSDEIDVVANAFNQMSQAVETSHKQMNQLTLELRHLNESLEEKVRVRTAELQNRNRELAEASEAVRAAQSQLLETEKRATVGVLTSGIAHEINNPLGFATSNVATLETYLDAYNHLVLSLIKAQRNKSLLSQEELNSLLDETDFEFMREDVLELFSDTKSGLDRVKVIVEKMGALKHGELIELDKLDTNEVIAEVLHRIENSRFHDVEIATPHIKLPEVKGSFEALVEALFSLLTNACQAIEKGGQVTIASVQKHRTLDIYVVDTGEGIREEIRDRIFDPFFTTRDVGVGSGLGLYRARLLLEAAGGQLLFDNDYTYGTRFVLSLPLADS